MCPLAQIDGHDAPRLIDEAVPGEAAVVDDVIVGFEDAVGDVTPAFHPAATRDRPLLSRRSAVEAMGGFRESDDISLIRSRN